MLQNKILKRLTSVISISTFRWLRDFLKYYVFGLFRRMEDNNLFFAASGISFSLFLGIIPFILLIFSLLSNMFDQASIENSLNNFIDQIIPYSAYANYVKRLISSRLPEVIEYKTLAGYIGVIGLLFTSTWIFSSIRAILNKIFQVKIQKGFIYGLIRDVLMVVLVLFLITFSTFVIPAINILYGLLRNNGFVQTYEMSALWNCSVYIFSLLLMFGLFFGLYYLIPYELLGKKVAALSAFWTTVLWALARSIFVYYVNDILKSNPLYGAFVLIIAVLFWVFYSSCLFIVGAEIGQLYRERLAIKLQTTKTKT